MSQGRSSSSSGGPDTRSKSAVSLRQALQGAVYPLSAEQLSRVARENGAPAAILTLLGSLPQGDFRSIDAVESRLGEGQR
ncbi:MAG TPA: DUF2795 domain-containing protein [Myxococcaceae bacterium]